MHRTPADDKNPAAQFSRCSASEAAAIDFNYLKSHFNLNDPGDLAFIASLKQAFQQHTEQCLNSLRQSIAAEDAEQVCQLAHGLKSASGNVGAMQLSSLCKNMERAGIDKQWQSTGELLNTMQQEYARTLAALNLLCV